MAADEKSKDATDLDDDRLGALGISRRRLAYVAPMILLSRKMIYRASGCGKANPRESNCRQAPRGS